MSAALFDACIKTETSFCSVVVPWKGFLFPLHPSLVMLRNAYIPPFAQGTTGTSCQTNANNFPPSTECWKQSVHNANIEASRGCFVRSATQIFCLPLLPQIENIGER